MIKVNAATVHDVATSIMRYSQESQPVHLYNMAGELDADGSIVHKRAASLL